MNAASSSEIVQEYVEKGQSKSCPIIDMHGHLGPLPGAYLPSASPKAMKDSLARAGVKRIICSSHEALLGDLAKGNALMQETIREYPNLFSGYWGINPHHIDKTAKTIDDFEKATGFVGFKLLPEYHSYPLTGRNYAPVLAYANRHRLLVLVHTWGSSSYNSPEQLAEVARTYPEAVFLMGHSGYGQWDVSVGIAKELCNVYLELTAVYVAHDFAMLPGGSGTPAPISSCLHVNGIVEYMVEHTSSEKIVFGTDMPWYSPHFAAGAVLFSHITDDDRHNILHRNAERLLASE